MPGARRVSLSIQPLSYCGIFTALWLLVLVAGYRKYPRHLTKQGDTFLVRIRINDPEIRAIIGKSEFIRALQTGWLAEAIRRSHAVTTEFLARISAARLQKSGLTQGLIS